MGNAKDAVRPGGSSEEVTRTMSRQPVSLQKNTDSNLTEHAHRFIKRQILSGKFTGESRFTEDFFAQQLGISKSPVREALNSLQSEGLLRIEARRGAFLYRFSAKEVADLYELREALEVFAASMVRITPDLVKRLRASVAVTVAALKDDRKQEYIDEDIRFHAAIVAATGNAELVRVHSNIQNKLWLCRCQTYRLTSPDTPESHRQLCEAIAAGDRTSACAVTRQHIRLVRDSLLADMAADAALTLAEPTLANTTPAEPASALVAGAERICRAK